jgi:hypothetical protein
VLVGRWEKVSHFSPRHEIRAVIVLELAQTIL